MGILHALYVSLRVMLVLEARHSLFPDLPLCWFLLIGDFFIPGFQCPHRTARIGTMGDGGKWVCGLERIQNKKQCVIYSFGKMHLFIAISALRNWLSSFLIRGFSLIRASGINGESSFEAELLEKAPGCQVWGYDFSVSSVSFHVVNPVTVLIPSVPCSGVLNSRSTPTEPISSPGHLAPSTTMVPT